MNEKELLEKYKKLTKAQLLIEKNNIKNEIEKLKYSIDSNSTMEQAIKLCLNSWYGALTAKGCAIRSPELGDSVTAMGRAVITYIDEIINHYFREVWHNDFETHKAMNLETVYPIPSVTPISIYGDTDSITGDSLIYINEIPMRIEHLWEIYNSEIITLHNGKEIKKSKDIITKSLNLKNEEIVNTNVTKIIKHKNTKKLYKIITESGKTQICTEDHNLIVKRDNLWLNINPTQIQKNDLIAIIYE